MKSNSTQKIVQMKTTKIWSNILKKIEQFNFTTKKKSMRFKNRFKLWKCKLMRTNDSNMTGWLILKWSFRMRSTLKHTTLKASSSLNSSWLRITSKKRKKRWKKNCCDHLKDLFNLTIKSTCEDWIKPSIVSVTL